MINDVETLARIQRDRYDDFVKEAAKLRLAQAPTGDGAAQRSDRRSQGKFAAVLAWVRALRAARQERVRTGLSIGFMRE